MAINLSKIQSDLANKDPQIKTFALISVTRLAPNLVEDAQQVQGLHGLLDGLIKSDNPDVVFLARKASNHLRAHFKEALVPPPAAAPRPDADPAKLDAEGLLASLAATDDPQRLSALIIRLVDKGRTEDLGQVAVYLKHGNDRVRSNALEVFAKHGDLTHIELVKPLLQDPSNRARGTAVLALDRFGYGGVADSLREMLQLSALSMRETAVWVLSQIDKPWVAGLLVQAMEDPYDGIRLRAVRSLAKYPTKESVRALKAAMNDIDINICEAAAESLRALKVLIQGARPARAEDASRPVVPAATPAAPVAPAAPELPVAVEEVETEISAPKEPAVAAPVAGGEADRAGIHRDLGTSIYQLCRLNAITHDSLDTTFYEILRYQDFLRAYLIKKQKAGGDAPEAGEAIRQLQQRIAQAFVELGKVAQGLLETQEIRVPSDHQAEVSGLLARLRG